MTRGVRWYLVGSLTLVTLAGCKQSWLEEREPWRREAEMACLKTGTVKESPSVALLGPINGPGMCGADFPLKVAALGESQILAHADWIGGDAIARWLTELPPAANSGDVYAALA